ncbi:hypothetical protein QYE76_023035 [Lolium multiflorum]|uniref:Pentatricopeptide repeat-containing protein n=1 Tax=Lolium multiflorum TaxID=4521 RepID=A0AAD8RDX3_LOLMU|nr:hypothetical protein QYE76_023035 [Lolium multiflorum]
MDKDASAPTYGRVADAERVVEALWPSATIITYTTMVNGYCRDGKIDAARQIIDAMPVAPDTFTYNLGFCVRRRVQGAFAVFDEMLLRGCSPRVVTCSILLDSTCKESGYWQAMVLLDQMRGRGFEPDIETYSVLINAICSEGDFGEALKVLNSLRSYGCKPDAVTYNPTLNSLCSSEQWDEAEKFLARMFSNSCAPDEMDKALDLLNVMISKGLYPDTTAYQSLAFGLSREDGMDRAIGMSQSSGPGPIT